MEKIHKNIRVFMLSCIKHACFRVVSPFSAYFSPHDIIAEKGLLMHTFQTTPTRPMAVSGQQELAVHYGVYYTRSA